jgi:Na+-translocating ferredoxin:NAD+ oxidoreductase subunit C
LCNLHLKLLLGNTIRPALTGHFFLRGILRHRLNVRPPGTNRETTLRWLAPTGHLRLLLRHYPLDRSEPLVEVGDRVEADAPLSQPRGLLAVPVHAPVAGEVTSFRRSNNQVTLLLKPDTGATPSHGFPTAQEKRSFSREEMEALLQQFPLLDNHLPLLLKLKLLSQHPERKLVINALDKGVFMETRLRLLSAYGEQLEVALQLLGELFEARPVLLLPQEHRRQILNKLPHLPASLKWTRNKYPNHLEHLALQAATGSRLSPAALPEARGIAVIELQTVLHFYHLLIHEQPSPWQWVSAYNPADQRVEAIATTRGVTRSWLPSAYGDSENWVSGDGYLRETSKFAPLRCLIQGEDILPAHPDRCIRCGFCLKICPEKLTPFQLTGLIESGHWQRAEKFGLEHCNLCGSCAMVCPAHIDLQAVLQKGIAELHGI